MLSGNITLNSDSLIATFKLLLLVLSILYFLFSIIVVRQVSLMTDSLVTEITPAFRVFAIIFAVISLAVVISFIKLL